MLTVLLNIKINNENNNLQDLQININLQSENPIS